MKPSSGAEAETEDIKNQLALLCKEKMRLQEEIKDLQESLEDYQEEICHFEKLLPDKCQEANRVVGKEPAWSPVLAGTGNELMVAEAALEEYQAVKTSLLESLDVQGKLSEHNELFQKIMRNLSDQLEARARALVEEEMQLEEVLLKMEGQDEKEVNGKQEKKQRFWSFWKWKHKYIPHIWKPNDS